MDIRKLQRLIVDALEDVKAQDIKVFNTTHLTELFDRVIIASGTSNRQTKALASSVRDSVKAAGGHIIAVEGTETGEWVLVDCGDAVVHILQPQLRMYYNLEEIWGDKPVRIKLDGGAKGLVKASEPMDDGSEEENARKPMVSRRTTMRPALAQLPAGMADPSEPMGHENDAVKAPRRVATRRATPRAAAGTGAAAGSASTAPARKTPARKTGTASPAARKTATAAPAARKRTPRAS